MNNTSAKLQEILQHFLNYPEQKNEALKCS